MGMFQSFEDVSDSSSSHGRVSALRTVMAKSGLDGFIVPRSDEHQGEYVGAYAERLRWLTGFTGSAGLAIVLKDKAAIFIDGRYTLQVHEQIDAAVFEAQHLIEKPPAKWLEGNLGEGDVLGYDPWLVTAAQADKFAKACRKAGATLKPTSGNLIDAVWDDQPQRPLRDIEVQPGQFAGRQSAGKLDDIRSTLASAKADATVLSLPDSIAWLFNVRGSDISHTPVVLAFAIVYRDGSAELFVDPARVPEDVSASLQGICVVRSPEKFEEGLKALGDEEASVMIDPTWSPQQVRSILKDAGAKIILANDPCLLPKARKNQFELEGARAAHLRDGVAMAKFLAWFDRHSQGGKLDEIGAAQKLEFFRQETGELKDISFDSISATGPHAAIPHYRVTETSNLTIAKNSIYLIDSGGQYQDGTTDITRTVIAGEPDRQVKDRFTRVLKGMINLSRVRFPAGTSGGNLDVLARLALWQAGLDFDHGTGHGVGSYLSVHEGPARFSKADTTKLETGMILSNEPGFYKAGEYGIRIENLVAVREPEGIEGGERAMHWLETLTLCPIDRRLVEVDLLDGGELEWLNSYHQRVMKTIGPLLQGNDLDWLKKATAKIGR